MKIISDFLSLFSENNVTAKDLNPIEDLYMAKLSYNIDKYINPDIDTFLKTSALICNVLETNTFQFSFKVVDKESLNFDVHPELICTLFSSYSENVEKIQEYYKKILNCEFNNIEDNEFVSIEIFIKKPLELRNINRVYFFDEFVESLNDLNLADIMCNTIFKNITENILFLIDHEIPEFYSENIYFIHEKDDFYSINLCAKDRSNLLIQHKLNCHFISSNLTVTPYSFRLLQSSECNVINMFFDKLEVITSLIYLSNYSELVNGNTLKLHINGYKLINESIDFKELSIIPKSFFDIFDWVYKENKISEKLQLARNIISLDYKDTLKDINDKTLASIESNYKIYLKENVDRYIGLKNQITEHILNLSMKSLEIVNSFSSNFKNAFLANLSFIFTVIILNIIGNPEITTDIFNRDLSILYLSVISISFIYLLISRYTTYKDLNHYTDTFLHMKNLYKGLLSPKDLDETFNNDILNSDKIHIKQKIRIYTIFWIITLIIGLICLYFLSQWVQTTSYNLYQDAIEVFKPID